MQGRSTQGGSSLKTTLKHEVTGNLRLGDGLEPGLRAAKTAQLAR
jgi:hypothetical protein